jgi:hypothetical protein
MAAERGPSAVLANLTAVRKALHSIESDAGVALHGLPHVLEDVEAAVLRPAHNLNAASRGAGDAPHPYASPWSATDVGPPRTLAERHSFTAGRGQPARRGNGVGRQLRQGRASGDRPLPRAVMPPISSSALVAGSKVELEATGMPEPPERLAALQGARDGASDLQAADSGLSEAWASPRRRRRRSWRENDMDFALSASLRVGPHAQALSRGMVRVGPGRKRIHPRTFVFTFSSVVLQRSQRMSLTVQSTSTTGTGPHGRSVAVTGTFSPFPLRDDRRHGPALQMPAAATPLQRRARWSDAGAPVSRSSASMRVVPPEPLAADDGVARGAGGLSHDALLGGLYEKHRQRLLDAPLRLRRQLDPATTTTGATSAEQTATRAGRRSVHQPLGDVNTAVQTASGMLLPVPQDHRQRAGDPMLLLSPIAGVGVDSSRAQPSSTRRESVYINATGDGTRSRELAGGSPVSTPLLWLDEVSEDVPAAARGQSAARNDDTGGVPLSSGAAAPAPLSQPRTGSTTIANVRLSAHSGAAAAMALADRQDARAVRQPRFSVEILGFEEAVKQHSLLQQRHSIRLDVGVSPVCSADDATPGAPRDARPSSRHDQRDGPVGVPAPLVVHGGQRRSRSDARSGGAAGGDAHGGSTVTALRHAIIASRTTQWQLREEVRVRSLHPLLSAALLSPPALCCLDMRIRKERSWTSPSKPFRGKCSMAIDACSCRFTATDLLLQ